MKINIPALEALTAEMKSLLKDESLATSIIDRSTGLSLGGINENFAACALFTELTATLDSTLAGSNFPALGRYYLLDIADSKVIVVIIHGNDLVQGLLVDTRKANLGILVSVVVPKMLKGVQDARR